MGFIDMGFTHAWNYGRRRGFFRAQHPRFSVGKAGAGSSSSSLDNMFVRQQNDSSFSLKKKKTAERLQQYTVKIASCIVCVYAKK
jgi:hypothetical protein